MAKADFHENLERSDTVKTGSERSFAWVFCVVFVLVGAHQTWKGSYGIAWFAAAAVVLGLGFAAPKALAPLNRGWTKLGLLLARIVNPLVLGVLFYAVITPFGLFMRSLGKRSIPLGFDRSARTYWVYRDPPAPDPDSMTNQF